MREVISDLNADKNVEEIDRICDAFEAAWQSGKAPDLASFLEQLSDSRLRAKLFSELLMLELAYRSMKGNTVAWSAYEQQFPNFLQQIEVVAKQAEVANRSPQPADDRDLGYCLETEDVVPQSLVDTDQFLHASASTDRDPTELPNVASTGGLTSIGGFRLLGVLGEGGFGTVYRAEDIQLRRKVAIKLLSPRALALPDAKERFIAEARALAAIHHDHVVPIFSVGSEAGQVFIALPLLAGETLAARIEREGALPPEEVRRIGRETAEGLAAIHAKGLVHRDLKPANIWLEVGTGRVKVLDLGLAHDPLTPLNELSGTPAYMSPEQARGERLDGRADLFSLGAVLYECATGRRACSGHTPATVLRSVCDETPTSVEILNPGVPSDIAQIITGLLSKDPSQRPTCAREVAAALEVLSDMCRKALTKDPAERSAFEFADALRASVATKAPTPRLPIAIAATFGGLFLCLAIWLALDRLNQPAADAGNNSTIATVPNRDSHNPATNPMQPASARLLPGATFTHFMNKSDTRIPGRLFENGVVREDDELRIELQFEEPVYCFLFAVNPDGAVQLCYPHPAPETYEELLDEVQADAISELKYPANENEGFPFTDGAGQQAFILVSSKKPLPSFREWSSSASNLTDALQASGHWVFADGKVSPWVKSDGERGAPRKLRGSEPFEKVMNAIQATNQECEVSGLSFPVEPK